ncbi:DDE_3 domain-containing protein [Trichonephila clavipes]|nr:DDE_3 domain-containing protein [Trichonephila clavipes]
MQEDQLCAFPSTDDSEGTAYAGQENMFLGRSNNGLLCCSQTSPDLQWRRWWNPGLGRISLGGHTDLHVFHGGTVTGLRYRDEILDPYVRPYASAIGNDFILMDDNARPHRARIVEEYLEDHGLERMEWPARSPDLNPIEHLWDYLGREVAALNPHSRSLHELKQGLLCVWSSLPIPVSDNLINSMEIDAANAFKLGVDIPLLEPIFVLFYAILPHNTVMCCFLQEWTFPQRLLLL